MENYPTPMVALERVYATKQRICASRKSVKCFREGGRNDKINLKCRCTDPSCPAAGFILSKLETDYF